MTEDIFFCYDTKEAPIMCHKALSQTQLSENIHHDLHGGVVSYSEWAHIKNASQFQWPRTFCWKRWSVLGKANPGAANNAFLLF